MIKLVKLILIFMNKNNNINSAKYYIITLSIFTINIRVHKEQATNLKDVITSLKNKFKSTKP